MNRDDVLRMAREANRYASNQTNDSHDWQEIRDERFAALVAAAEREHYDNLFQQLKAWCNAYPIGVFPEPDFKKAHEVLTANGMTLDSISASNMRHVITQVQKMVDGAIRARGQK